MDELRNRLAGHDCFPVSCQAGSPQETWLRQQLASVPADKCVIAYWHHPTYASGSPADNPETAPLFDALYDNRADVVLAGHSHSYERLAPMNASGGADPTGGVRSFVVGTGGKSRFADPGAFRPGSEFFLPAAQGHGVLEMTLHQSSYEFRFVHQDGSVRDQSSAAIPCHG